MSSANKNIRTLVIAVVLSGLVVGCQESKIAQCNRLTQVANKTAEEVQMVVRNHTVPDNGAFLKVAAQYEQGQVAMKAVNLADPQLQAYQQRFMALYTDVATSAKNVAQGMADQNLDATTQAHTTFQSATRLELPLVEAVNTYCGSASTPQ
jgi:hypothetical protein